MSGALALALVASALATAAEGRRTYVRRCQDLDGPAPGLLEDLEHALAAGAPAGEVAYLLDRLLEEATKPEARGVVVETTFGRFVGLRAHVLERAASAPAAVVDALRRLQALAAAGARRSLGPAALLERHPFSPQAAEAARALAARAIASGDLPLARAHLDALERLHPDAAAAPERAALRLLAGAAERAAAPAPSLGSGAPAVAWRARFGPTADPAASPIHPAYLPAADGERVVACDGARALVLDLRDGAVVGRVPLAPDAIGRAPDAATGFAGRVATWAGVAFTPLVLERWLVPGRADQGDFAGRFYSLVAIDAARGRLLWWDGDPGPATSRRLAPGLADGPEPLVDALRGAHAVAAAADEARVYVALLLKSDEPELSLFAYERAGGATQPLVLRPAWSALVPLFSAERPRRAGADEPVAPELAAALALDGAGALLVTTDVGVVACVEVGSGEVRWIARAELDPRPRPRAARFGPQPLEPPDAPPQPARLVDGADGRHALVLLGQDVRSIRVRDGVTAWSAPKGRADRLLLADGHAVVYGQRELLILEAATGAPRHRAPAEEHVVGDGVAVGRAVFLPVHEGTAAKLRRIDLWVDGVAVAPRRSPLAAMPDHTPPYNLALSPRGLLAASARAITLHAWER